MIKLFHVVAIGALISSAVYAYSIKYETLYQGEKLAKLKLQGQREREAIAVLKAEWQHLNRPDRLQFLSERHLQLQPLAATQLVRFADIPAKGPKVDDIGKKLEALGLVADSAPTASLGRPATAAAAPRSPLSRPSVAASGSRPPVTARPAASAAAPVTRVPQPVGLLGSVPRPAAPAITARPAAPAITARPAAPATTATPAIPRPPGSIPVAAPASARLVPPASVGAPPRPAQRQI
jgi:hypothetical protein